MSRVKRHKLNKELAGKTPEKKKRLSKQAIWTIILGSIMVFSVFGIMFSSYNSGQEQTKYGKYKFIRTSGGWSTEINGKTAEFSYLPADLKNINVSSDVIQLLNGSKVLYITFNPYSKNVQTLELMRFELGNSMMQLFGKYMMPGITNESEQYTQPIVDCGNSTITLPVIDIIESNQTNAYIKKGCLVIEVDQYSALAMKDKILYSLLGII